MSYRDGSRRVGEFLNPQQDFNEVVRESSQALVRHRRDMLDPNTAVATRVLPGCPGSQGDGRRTIGRAAPGAGSPPHPYV